MTRKKERKRQASTIDDILSATFKRAIKDDPDLRLRLAFLSEGFPEMAGQVTAESRHLRQTEAMITGTALDMIENDESLKRSMAEVYLKQVITERTRRDQDEGLVSEASLVAEVIAELKKSVLSMGIPSSEEIGKLITPAAIKKALFSVQDKQQSAVASLIFTLNNGRLDMLTMPQFKKLLKERKLMPVYKVSPELSTTANQEKTTGVPGELIKPTPEPEQMTGTTPTDLSPSYNAPMNLSPEVAVSPEEFFGQLKDEAGAGVVDAGLLLNFLRGAKYKDIKSMLEPYRNNTKLKKLINAINTDNGKIWIEKVIELLKKDKQDHGLFIGGLIH